MERLHGWQQQEPLRFQRLGFKIHKKGAREALQVKKFFSYSGADELTRHVLRTNAQMWLDEPLRFWSRPQQNTLPGSFVSTTASLVTFYVNAKYDDA